MRYVLQKIVFLRVIRGDWILPRVVVKETLYLLRVPPCVRQIAMAMASIVNLVRRRMGLREIRHRAVLVCLIAISRRGRRGLIQRGHL